MLIIIYLVILLCLIKVNAKGRSFPTSKYIKEINEIDGLINEVSKERLSLILIYSVTCPHCVNFHPHFKELSEKYYSQAHFYQVNAMESNSYRKKFNIRGFPSLWFHYNNTYTELKSNYNQKYISELIEKKYLFTCSEVDSEKAKAILSLNIDNSLLGIFNNNFTLQAYLNITYLNKELVRECYYIYKKEANSSIVYSLNEQKGINAFDKFSYLNYNNDSSGNYERLAHQFSMFIKNKATRLYLDFKGGDDSKDIDSIDNQMMILSYKTKEEKSNYIQLLKDLNLQYGSLLSCSFVLFDINSNVRKFNKYPFANRIGMYISDSKYKNITQITEIDTITNAITINSKEDEDDLTQKTAINNTFINKELLKIIDNNDNAKEQSNLSDYYNEITYGIYIIIYSVIFYCLWNYLIKRHCDEEDLIENAITDMEEMKVINEIVE